MKHKGYIGEVRYDDKDKIFWGKVVNISKDGISFEGRTPEELESDFRGAVDDYITFKKENGEQPEEPFSGKFSVRIPNEMHEAAVEEAARRNVSLNKFVEKAIEHELEI
jgi:predicted HicB family RNase H-like nuclease